MTEIRCAIEYRADDTGASPGRLTGTRYSATATCRHRTVRRSSGAPMNEDGKADLRARVLDRRRIATFVEGMMQGFGAGRGAAPQGDYSIKRFQPDPKQGLVSLCKEIPAAVGTVYGVPPVLMNGAGSETQTREAYRRFVATAIGPLARLVEGVLTATLERPVSLDLGALRSWDVAGQARAYHVLRQGGMSDADAMDHAGLSA